VLFAVALAVVLAAQTLSAQEAGAAQEPRDPDIAVEPEKDPHTSEAERLQDRLETLGGRRQEFESRIRQASGEDRLVLERQNWQLQLETHATIRGLAANLLRQESEGRDVTAPKQELTHGLERRYPSYPRLIDRRLKRLTELRTERDAATGSDVNEFERRLTEEENRLQILYRSMLEILVVMDSLGLDVEPWRADAAKRVTARAETLAGRIEVFRTKQKDLTKRLTESPDDAALQDQLEIIAERLKRSTDNLSATVALMAKLDLERAQYQQLLIQATGEITADILDSEVALGLLGQWRDQALEQVATRGPSWLVKLLFLVLILAAFRVLAAITRRIVSRSVGASRLNLSRLLQETLVSWSSRIVMAIGFLVALGQLGIQIGPLLAGLGIAGFVLGFALQDSLSNFAAGAMILIYRPFDVGDVIEAAGIAGKVSRMSLVSTTILTFDNQTLIVPNNKIWGDVIRNVTAQTIRRVDLVFGIGYADDVEHAESVFRDVVAKHEKVLADPKPTVKLHALGESSVDFIVRPWCRKEDYWDVYWDLTREVKLRFDREGISIPFPQRDVHVFAESSSQNETDR